MRRYISLLFILLLASCSVEDFNTVKPISAPEFTGKIETGLEVDLGLTALWAGYNVGADTPSHSGSYYAWGETEVKAEYNEDNYIHNGKLVAGQKLSDSDDVATQKIGYGWMTPSAEDWQELADNCTITLAEYNGVVGYVATSKVAGYEGKSIFFPCSGYKAASNTNNVGSQALYWANRVVGNAETRAVNAFFTNQISGAALLLNMPPKGAGGLTWCGYPVRGIKKFNLDWNAVDCSVDRLSTSVEVEITGNAMWTIYASNGAICTPSSGTGAGKVVITFPKNETTKINNYQVTLTSPEFQDNKSFEITQFGEVPDFKFTQESIAVAWDAQAAVLELEASEDVSWSGIVKDVDGNEVIGASLSPSNGVGAASVNVILPYSTDIFDVTQYYVELTTSDSRIPVDIQTIRARIDQEICPYTPFGTVWGNSFMSAWNQSGFVANASFSAETATASGSSALSNPGKDNGYIKGKYIFTFTVAETGLGVLQFYTIIAAITHKFNITATRAGQTVFYKEYELGTTNRTLVSCEMDLEKGDIVKIEYSNGSSNAKLLCGKSYPISWTKKQ